MLKAGGYEIERVAEIPWEDRVNVDGWPSKAGMYRNDVENQLCMRLINYPVGSVEPRHVHGGSHATTVLKGRAIVDGVTLGPLDVILGPSNEPHGPLDYPDSCQLFSVFYGSYYHSEVGELSAEKQYRLIQSKELPWETSGRGIVRKVLVDRGVGPLLLHGVRADAGARMENPKWLAALIVEGEASIGDARLGAWDFAYAPRGTKRDALQFPKPTTLLTVSLQ